MKFRYILYQGLKPLATNFLGELGNLSSHKLWLSLSLFVPARRCRNSLDSYGYQTEPAPCSGTNITQMQLLI